MSVDQTSTLPCKDRRVSLIHSPIDELSAHALGDIDEAVFHIAIFAMIVILLE